MSVGRETPNISAATVLVSSSGTREMVTSPRCATDAKTCEISRCTSRGSATARPSTSATLKVAASRKGSDLRFFTVASSIITRSLITVAGAISAPFLLPPITILSPTSEILSKRNHITPQFATPLTGIVQRLWRHCHSSVRILEPYSPARVRRTCHNQIMSVEARALSLRRLMHDSAAIRLLAADNAPMILALLAEHSPRGTRTRPAAFGTGRPPQ